MKNFSTNGLVYRVLVYGYAFQASSSTFSDDFGNKAFIHPKKKKRFNEQVVKSEKLLG